MRRLSLLVAAVCALAAVDTPLTGGTGMIYLASHGSQIVGVDEATEKVTLQIPLKTGHPWAMHLSRDGTRFYVQAADQERFEVVDAASRQTLDTFTLSSGNTHVRALAYDVDPQQRVMVLVTRSLTKLVDRFEIGAPTFIQYDLKEHKVIRTVPWDIDPEPQYYYLNLKFSPDGKLLYVFAHEILVFDANTLEQVDSWDLSLPNEPGLGGFDLGSMDETNDQPGFFTALFTMADPVQNRKLLVVGRVDLARKTVESFPVGPAPENRQASFALAPDHKRGYVLLQEIGHYELMTIDMTARRHESTVTFAGRPRMAMRSSTNGKILYIFEAGNTIDLYEAATFKFLRRITLDGDMMYNTFHVVPPRRAGR